MSTQDGWRRHPSILTKGDGETAAPEILIKTTDDGTVEVRARLLVPIYAVEIIEPRDGEVHVDDFAKATDRLLQSLQAYAGCPEPTG